MPVHLECVGSDVSGAAGVRTRHTASGRSGSKGIQTVNMGNLCRGVGLRSGEVADMIDRRRLDFCCVQETRWKVMVRCLTSDKAQCKFIGTGNSTEGLLGVDVLVAEKWYEHIIEVMRQSERVIVLRVTIGKRMMNVISVYAPQVDRTMIEEEFLDLFRDIISGIDDRDGIIL
jgi:exonuclease III